VKKKTKRDWIIAREELSLSILLFNRAQTKLHDTYLLVYVHSILFYQLGSILIYLLSGVYVRDSYLIVLIFLGRLISWRTRSFAVAPFRNFDFTFFILSIDSRLSIRREKKSVLS